MGLKQQLKRRELEPVPDGKGGWQHTPELMRFLREADDRKKAAWRKRYPEAWAQFQAEGAALTLEAVRLVRERPEITDDELRAAGVSSLLFPHLRTPEGLAFLETAEPDARMTQRNLRGRGKR